MENALDRFLVKLTAYDKQHNTYLAYYLNGMNSDESREVAKLLEDVINSPDEWREKELLNMAHEEAARVRAEHQAEGSSWLQGPVLINDTWYNLDQIKAMVKAYNEQHQAEGSSSQTKEANELDEFDEDSPIQSNAW